MSWLKKVFGSQSSQETKVYDKKKEGKEKKDKNREKMDIYKLTIAKLMKVNLAKKVGGAPGAA